MFFLEPTIEEHILNLFRGWLNQIFNFPVLFCSAAYREFQADSKMVLDLVLMVFYVYLHGLYHKKPQNTWYSWDFWKYYVKTGQFLTKLLPKLKIAISQKHIFINNLRKKYARKLKFSQVMRKMIGKTCTIQIFYFWPHFEKNGLCMLQNRFWSIHNPLFSKWGRK